MVDEERCFVVDIEASDYDGGTDVQAFNESLSRIKEGLGVKTARLQVSKSGARAGGEQ